MADGPDKMFLNGVLIALLHLPLVFYATTVYTKLPAGSDLTELDPVSLAILLVLVVLPYAALAMLGIRWNPERARLNEIID